MHSLATSSESPGRRPSSERHQDAERSRAAHLDAAIAYELKKAGVCSTVGGRSFRPARRVGRARRAEKYGWAAPRPGAGGAGRPSLLQDRMDAIRTEALTKHYKVGFWRPRPYLALDAVSFSVAQGEVFGFLGPNGAGKTTTLKLLMQLTYPDFRARRDPRPPRRRRRTSGAASATCRKTPTSTITSPRRNCSTTSAGSSVCLAHDRRPRTTRLLDEVGIGAERRLQLRKFSKGMLQRVGIAQALINEPEVVFLDEPMSGLDPIGRREIRELILQLRERGCTVFFSSHVLSDAEALCSRVAILVGGRLAAEGSAVGPAGGQRPRLGDCCHRAQ